jgi:hypothetical protein
MAYLLVVVLTMFLLPIASILIELSLGSTQWLWLIGKWFVFWGVGVRLLMAGLRQYLQPAFTSRDIMGIESPEAYLLVRELGGANIASGIVGLASIAAPTFVLPSAIAAAIFYAVAAAEHVKSTRRNRTENIALISDVFIAIVLLGFSVGVLGSGVR